MASSEPIDSVNPPGAGADASRRLGSILLDRQRANGSKRNETTASAHSKDGYSFSVSFWMAEPPGISCFSVPDPTPRDFTLPPHVVGADGRFVLLRAQFYSCSCFSYGKDEYFMYKAGSDGESPSLDWVPLPDDDDEGTALGRVSVLSEFGIVDHGDHYLLAALCDVPDAPANYHLRIYSSKTKAWSTKKLLNLNPWPGARRIIPDKVISLGEGSLAWVDLSCGLLACDGLRQDPPAVLFIPLPEPLPGNRDKVDASLTVPRAAATSFRDLACSSGVLKFIEMERHGTEEPKDPADKDVLHDSDLIKSLKPKSRDCWRAVTWSRRVCSNSWRKECTISGDDILLDETKHPALASRLRGRACGKLTLSDLYSAFPTLNVDDGILYLMCVAAPGDKSGWVVAVDLGNRTVKATAECSFKEHDTSNQAFRPCTLSRYLNMTPGTEVSACRQVVHGSSATLSLKALLQALRPPPRSPRPLTQFPPPPPWSPPRLPPPPQLPSRQGFPPPPPWSPPRLPPPPQLPSRPWPPHVGSNPEMKRLCSILDRADVERTKRARNEAHTIVQNDHVSEDQPAQTNLTLQQCVNMLDQPLNPVDEQQPSPSNKLLGEFHHDPLNLP